MTDRERLTRLAYAAGYGPDTLLSIAEAAIPAFQGGLLGDAHIHTMCDAVEVLAQAGCQDSEIGAMVAGYRRLGAAWRDAFWAQQVRTATLRFNHPAIYGLSPCETDPSRLAAHSGPLAEAAIALLPPIAAAPLATAA
jgi:hypothetical protein